METKKNFLYDQQHLFDNNENHKLIASNVGDKIMLNLVNAELIKEFY